MTSRQLNYLENYSYTLEKLQLLLTHHESWDMLAAKDPKGESFILHFFATFEGAFKAFLHQIQSSNTAPELKHSYSVTHHCHMLMT